MNAHRIRLLACAAVLFLGACTGTSEPRPPTMLIVGITGAGGPELVLLEDAGPQASPRLRYVAGSERVLSANAVAIDFEDRAGARAAAWVLSRSVASAGGTPQVSAYLQRFDVEGIDVASPTAFAEDAAAALTLSEPGGGLLVNPSIARQACPTALQVSRLGRWAVVLDDPAVCGLAGFPVQWLVDTRERTATPLGGDTEVLATSPYTDQSQGGESAYFLVRATWDAQVFAVDLSVDAPGSGAWYENARIITGESGATFLDMAGSEVAGGARVLSGLSTARVGSVDLGEPAATRSPVSLGNGAQLGSRLVADPSGVASELVVLDPSRTTVLRTPTGPEVGSAAFAAAAATTDPILSFGYVLGQRGVLLIDFLSGRDLYDEDLRTATVSVPELTLPTSGGRPVGAIAWVRARLPDTP
ncbi:MAG: hypothetical protein KIT12_07570 [Trueperaceae bacterium]|nr:hypothetical protein [Trueperaceae bacterium]